jgi:hypothetical protein
MEKQDNNSVATTIRFVDEGENTVKVIVVRGGVTFEQELFVFSDKQIKELEYLKTKNKDEILEPA